MEIKLNFCWSFLILTSCLLMKSQAGKPPHILFIVADDLGWNDIGYHNPDIISPNIDHLALNGVRLNQSYVQPLCSPSRSAFMTGVYPYKMGLQHLVIVNEQEVCVPSDKVLLPQVLKTKGYATHIVGKWHLGFCNWTCTPTYRGFDSFMGYYSAQEDYYAHKDGPGYDFRDNEKVDWNANGTYSAIQFTERAKKIINQHNPAQPLFLYLPFQNVHVPLEVPDKYLKLYPNITDKNRKHLSGMVSALDDAIGQVIKALKVKGMYEDTLIAFSADNGGMVTSGGNNYPLRGGKFTIYEGGTRVPGFFHGRMLDRNGTTFDGLMHAVDWLPTLAAAANITNLPNTHDGINQWDAINSRSRSNRNQFVYNMDLSLLPLQGRYAIRVGDYKLIDGFPGIFPDWYKPASVNHPANLSVHVADWSSLTDPYVQKTIALSQDYQQQNSLKALYNVKDDPTEHNNLYDSMPEKVKELQKVMDELKKDYTPPNFPLGNPKSNPKYYDGAWSPGWC